MPTKELKDCLQNRDIVLMIAQSDHERFRILKRLLLPLPDLDVFFRRLESDDKAYKYCNFVFFQSKRFGAFFENGGNGQLQELAPVIHSVEIQENMTFYFPIQSILGHKHKVFFLPSCDDLKVLHPSSEAESQPKCLFEKYANTWFRHLERMIFVDSPPYAQRNELVFLTHIVAKDHFKKQPTHKQVVLYPHFKGGSTDCVSPRQVLDEAITRYEQDAQELPGVYCSELHEASPVAFQKILESHTKASSISDFCFASVCEEIQLKYDCFQAYFEEDFLESFETGEESDLHTELDKLCKFSKQEKVLTGFLSDFFFGALSCEQSSKREKIITAWLKNAETYFKTKLCERGERVLNLMIPAKLRTKFFDERLKTEWEKQKTEFLQQLQNELSKHPAVHQKVSYNTETEFKVAFKDEILAFYRSIENFIKKPFKQALKQFIENEYEPWAKIIKKS